MYDVAYVNCQAIISPHSLDKSRRNLGCEGIRNNLVYPAGGRRKTIQTMRPLVTGQNGSGQNGTDKMVWTKWYTDKMVLDKMVRTKWYGQNGTILYFVYP